MLLINFLTLFIAPLFRLHLDTRALVFEISLLLIALLSNELEVEEVKAQQQQKQKQQQQHRLYFVNQSPLLLLQLHLQQRRPLHNKLHNKHNRVHLLPLLLLLLFHLRIELEHGILETSLTKCSCPSLGLTCPLFQNSLVQRGVEEEEVEERTRRRQLHGGFQLFIPILYPLAFQLHLPLVTRFLLKRWPRRQLVPKLQLLLLHLLRLLLCNTHLRAAAYLYLALVVRVDLERMIG